MFLAYYVDKNLHSLFLFRPCPLFNIDLFFIVHFNALHCCNLLFNYLQYNQIFSFYQLNFLHVVLLLSILIKQVHNIWNLIINLTCSIPGHLNDAFAVPGDLPGVEGANPHCHFYRRHGGWWLLARSSTTSASVRGRIYFWNKGRTLVYFMKTSLSEKILCVMG